MSSAVEFVAEALAYRWGELQEKPPAFIDELMIELTTALAAARQSGEEDRAECLDEVLDALAEGIYKYERQADEDEETLSRAIAEIRTHYYLESGIPRIEIREREESPKRSTEPVRIFSDRDKIPMILN
jgi:AcrR family transcriptional regulator